MGNVVLRDIHFGRSPRNSGDWGRRLRHERKQALDSTATELEMLLRFHTE